MATVHPTAIVENDARLGDGVEVGPYCVVGPKAVLEDGVRLEAHVVIDGRTEVGAHTRVSPFVSLGFEAQDVKGAGGDTRLVIGRNNVIREHCTFHRGTDSGGGVTRVGDNCYFMVNSHVAHDCQLGDHVIMSNNAVMGGHVTIGDHVILGGNTAVHQFVRIGRHAMLGGLGGAEQDVIPYGLVYGNRDGLCGLNLIGLKRRGFSKEEVNTLRRAYKELFEGSGTMAGRIDRVANDYAESPYVMEIIDFIRAKSARAILAPRLRRAR